MSSKKIRIISLLTSFVIIIQACNTPSSKGTVPDVILPSATVTFTANPSTPQATIVVQSTNETSAEHQVVPINIPASISSHASDFDSSRIKSSSQAVGGDRFTFERFERPFNANNMDIYFPQLDIVNTAVLQDSTWIYGTIQLNAADADGALSGRYALEIDSDRDGKGDWLIIASNPKSADWTTTGVQVYQDENKTVGNATPMYTDEDVVGDGFEKLVFDQGKGEDPDTAWVRLSSDSLNTIEISVKRSALGNPEKYMINMWAGNSLLDPALFDLSDHFTHEQAGAADPGLKLYYPIKQISEIDNSCRLVVGFQPTGLEPGICDFYIQNAQSGWRGSGGSSGGSEQEGGSGCPACPSGYNQVPYPSCMCIVP